MVSDFLTDVCGLVNSTFSAVFAEPLLAFSMTVMLAAVAAGLFLYIFRQSKRI